MSDVIIPYRFKVLGNTAAALAADTGIPKERELVIETDTGRDKLGDGSTGYPLLKYRNLGSVDFSALADGRVPAWDAASSTFKMVAQSGGGGAVDPLDGLIDPLYDFIAKPPNSATASAGASYPWTGAFAGSGAAIASVDGGSAHPGVWRLATGTATSGRASLILGDLPCLYAGAGVIRIPFAFRVPTLSDGTNGFIVNIGLRDTWTAAVGEGIYLSYTDDANSGKLQLIAAVGGVLNPVNGTTAVVAGAWVSGYLEVVADGSEASVTIGGVVEATVSSGLPTGAMSAGAICSKSGGTTSRSFDLDYLGPPAITFTTPR